MKNQYLREPLGIRMNKTQEIGSVHNYTDSQIASIQREYLQSRLNIYCPYQSCNATGCSCCSVAIREEAHKYAAQIFAERQAKLATVEAIAAHILKIPIVVAGRVKEIPESNKQKLYECIAIHLLRICSLEKGIVLSNGAITKLFADMHLKTKEDVTNE